MAKTKNYNLVLPDESHNISEEFPLLRNNLNTIDGELATNKKAIDEKAAKEHTHETKDINGLEDALNGKMSNTKTFGLADLTDIDNFKDAPTSYALVKNTDGKCIFVSPAAALGKHSHKGDDILDFKERVLDIMVSGAIEMLPFEEPGYRMMVANGALYNRADFPVLWAAIKFRFDLVTEAQWNNGFQGAFSKGDGSTTFRVPNVLGYFPRFLDTNGTVDLGRKVGSRQGDAIRNITGAFATTIPNNHSSYVSGVFGGAVKVTTTAAQYNYQNGTSIDNNIYGYSINASKQVPTASENRPLNIALLPFIRF